MRGSLPERGRTAIACATLAAGLLLSCAPAGNPQSEPGSLPAPAPAPASGIQVLDSLLAERMAELARRSETWQAGLDSLRVTGFRVVIAQPEQVRTHVPGLENYAARHFGEVLPLRDAAGELTGAVVTVDVRRLRRLWRLTALPRGVLEADIDRILIHEVYGHVLPLAQSRRLSGGCPDPVPGEPASSSCAIRRENRIRAELGLEPRTTYDLRGLATGRALDSEGAGVLLPEPDPR